MKYLAAYALVALSGKAPTQADVKAVLKAADVTVDQDRISSLFAELDGKSFDEVCNEGKAKLVGTGSGAGAGAAAASGGAAAGTSAAGNAAAPAAEVKAEEPAEEEDDDMGFGLFD